MYNIKRNDRSDYMLGCSVQSHAEAELYCKRYKERYPAYAFWVVRTEYVGDMANVSLEEVKEQIRRG